MSDAQLPRRHIKRHGTPWTRQEVEQAKRLQAKGWTHPQIAQAMYRTPHAVEQRLYHQSVIDGATGNWEYEWRKQCDEQNSAFIDAMRKHHPDKETPLNQGIKPSRYRYRDGTLADG